MYSTMCPKKINEIVEKVEKDLDCFEIEEIPSVLFSEIDSSDISSDLVTKKVGKDWKVVSTGEKVDLEKLQEMDEITEWSYPYRLKRDKDFYYSVQFKRNRSKKSVRWFETLSDESLRNLSKFKSFWLFGRKVDAETIKKILRTKNLKKKYLTKIVPREVNYSGVQFK